MSAAREGLESLWQQTVAIPNKEVSQEYVNAISTMDWHEVIGSVEASRKLLEALWAVEGVGFPCINMGIMAGAPTVNSTNVYPNLDRWEILDQKGTNEKVYNRYAHISIVLKESGNPEFLLNQPDVFTVSLTGSSLKQLGVTYLMSGRESLREYESEKIKFIKIKNVGNYSIYRIE